MRVRPYADRPLRAVAQATGDLAVLAWSAAWVTAAVAVHGMVLTMGGAGYRLQRGARGIASNLGSAGDAAARLPLAGDVVSAPLRSAGGAAAEVAGAGGQFGDGLDALALPLAAAVVAGTVLPVAVPWLLARWRWARRAGVAVALHGSEAGDRLLALRALAGRPVHRLVAVSPDPAAAWTAQDPAVVAALADLELRSLGLVPRRRPAPAPSTEPAAAPEPEHGAQLLDHRET